MTDLEPQKTRITHSLVHGQGRNPRFCGVCNLFLFVFFLNWIPFFFIFSVSDLIQFIYVSLSRSLVSHYVETLVVIVSKGLSPPTLSIRVSLSLVPHQTHTR